ncbi:gfo/Idh/MocA family oxidoreductase [Xylanibacillus composti]|uniref:Gfo/Idh/MocA family oxidoreductase n=1 Tax=Xylanibacillus composti TaxID=1572762 RepID=A0A8J4GZH7_9BACL|nr:Gfo/Idh/MocA family oxidoreductase [Xylanibacillus composti]MDT9726193.1 gfo/Idh/MocA family oxidoreductase [Xylanibacillus composti]GIQ68039.1 Gfo/Idh/MocA family oxidoreductase [Xylanibacillus composti]
MQKTLIIGFGRAGRGLHWHCLRRAYADDVTGQLFNQTVGVVDPKADSRDREEPNLVFFSSLNEVAGFDPDHTVVHICTPPELHEAMLSEAAEHGYTRIIMEKPLTTTMTQLDRIRLIQERYAIDLLVVANWLSSTLTERLHALIQSGVYGPLRHIKAEQDKPRLSRTIANPSHENAFDVEIPHLAALALFLGGTEIEVVSAESADMRIDGRIFPHMGRARMSMLHHRRLTSELHSNLEAPIRKRRIELYFDRHRVIGYYPSSQDDSFSWMKTYGADGRLLEEKVMYDDTLSAVFMQYYNYYDGRSSKPVSDLAFNARVVSAICQAKSLCGLMLEEDSIREVMT